MLKVTIIAPLKVERLLPGSRCDRAWKNMSVQEKLLWYKNVSDINIAYQTLQHLSLFVSELRKWTRLPPALSRFDYCSQ